MAQVKYKHGTVQKARHIVRNLTDAAGSMLWTVHNEDLPVKAQEYHKDAYMALQATRADLQGRTGLSQEEQTRRIASAYDGLTVARRAVSAAAKARTLTSHEANMYDAITGTIDEARQHLTSGKQFAKDRKFQPKDEGPKMIEAYVVDVEVDDDDEI